MKPTLETAEESVEIFGETCAKLAALNQTRATILRAAGVSQRQWEAVAEVWNVRLDNFGDESRDLGERFRRSYNRAAAEVGVAPWAEPEGAALPPKPAEVPALPALPALQTPSFLLPPPPPVHRPRGESPWACTVQTPAHGGAECRAPLPFQPADSKIPSAAATIQDKPNTWIAPGTGTLALADIAEIVAHPRVPFAPGTKTMALADMAEIVTHPRVPFAPGTKTLALADMAHLPMAPAEKPSSEPTPPSMVQATPCSETAPSAFHPSAPLPPSAPVTITILPAPQQSPPPTPRNLGAPPSAPRRARLRPQRPIPTMALVDLPEASKFAPPQLEDEDSERTVMGLPAQWPPHPHPRS